MFKKMLITSLIILGIVAIISRDLNVITMGIFFVNAGVMLIFSLIGGHISENYDSTNSYDKYKFSPKMIFFTLVIIAIEVGLFTLIGEIFFK